VALFHPVSQFPIQAINASVMHSPPAFPPKDSNSHNTPQTTEIGQYRSYAQKFAESVGLEVKGTWEKTKEEKWGADGML
jgi:hypothetical protein